MVAEARLFGGTLADALGRAVSNVFLTQPPAGDFPDPPGNLRAPLTAPPVEVAPEEELYLHFGVMERLPSGRLVTLLYAGKQHGSGAGSDAWVVYSDDFGLTWSDPSPICEGLETGVECRPLTLGVTDDGVVVAMYLEEAPRGADGQESWLFLQRTSLDGETWTAPEEVEIVGGNPSSPTGSQLLTYGQIERLDSGVLATTAYWGPFNYVLMSEDDAETWRLETMVDSRELAATDADLPADVDLNETALQIHTETEWFAVSRIGRSSEPMRQFATSDGGETWRDLGPINLPNSGGYVSPALDGYVDDDGVDWAILSFMSREPASGAPPIVNEMLFFVAPIDQAATRSDAWIFAGSLPGDGSFENLSGYPSIVVDQALGEAAVIAHDEESASVARPILYRIDLEALIDQATPDASTVFAGASETVFAAPIADASGAQGVLDATADGGAPLGWAGLEDVFTFDLNAASGDAAPTGGAVEGAPKLAGGGAPHWRADIASMRPPEWDGDDAALFGDDASAIFGGGGADVFVFVGDEDRRMTHADPAADDGAIDLRRADGDAAPGNGVLRYVGVDAATMAAAMGDDASAAELEILFDFRQGGDGPAIAPAMVESGDLLI